MGRGGGEEEDEESGEFTSLATLWPTHTHTQFGHNNIDARIVCRAEHAVVLKEMRVGGGKIARRRERVVARGSRDGRRKGEYNEVV